MTMQISDPAGDIRRQLHSAIEAALPGAEVEVGVNSPGHYQLRVVSSAFAGKSRLQQQQLVYQAIAHLMKGDAAPVHAVDKLETVVPG